MNLEKLKQAEALFLSRYPGGFADPEMAAIAKKHKMEKMQSNAQEYFSEDRFARSEELSENLIRFVSASSMVSVFEKPRFRDYVRSLSGDEKSRLTEGLHEMLYLDEERGFNEMLAVLLMGKLGKWTLMSVVPSYMRPQKNPFIKPTTVKNILSVFELEGLVYKPAPSYDFYKRYRDALNEMKSHVDPGLAPTNAAFSGFLMMTMDQLK